MLGLHLRLVGGMSRVCVGHLVRSFVRDFVRDLRRQGDGVLDLQHQLIGDETVEAWLQPPSVRLPQQRQEEGQRSVPRLPEFLSLQEFGTIVTVELSYNRIGDKGAGMLARCLGVDRCVETLCLCGNRIGDDGAGVRQAPYSLLATASRGHGYPCNAPSGSRYLKRFSPV